jgi:hypothetical protein
MDFFKSLRSSTSIGAKVLAQSQRRTKVDKRKETLCKLLIAKYKRKYGKTVPSTVIVAQVNRFVDTMPLTGRNLEKLEQCIQVAGGKVPYKNGKAVPEMARENVKSTELPSLSDFKKNTQANREENGLATSCPIMQEEYATAGDSSMPMTEDEEWAAIMKYNQGLYKEEARQEELRKMREKKYLMNELKKQMREKEEMKKAMDQEEQEYMTYQTNALKRQKEIEVLKEEERRRLLLSEQQLRSRQTMEDAFRKQMEEEESKEQDRRLVERMREAIELERRTERKRREQQREIMTKMIEDSLKIKEKQKAQEIIEKEQDVKRQKRQQEIAEMQEQEWKENMRRKDERNRLLMENSERTGGAKTQREEAELENRRMNEQMRIMNERQDEEERVRILNQMEAKKNMRAILDKQIEEKKRMKGEEEEDDRKQVEMWQRETELARQQEEMNLRRQEEFKRRHQDYLMNQMVTTRQSRGGKGMTHRDFMLNKKVIDDMKVKQSKLRASTGFH